jgi:hypothetical protein
MRRTGKPRGYEVGGAVQRVLGPADRLAELPVGPPGHIARDRHPVAQRQAVGRDVVEVPPDDHVVGVALRGDGELSALADRRQPACDALGTDHAQHGGATFDGGKRRGRVPGVSAVRPRNGRKEKREQRDEHCPR